MKSNRETAAKAAGGDGLNQQQAAALLAPSSWSDVTGLMARACRLREEHLGQAVELCAIVNARSGLCSEDCAFCAQSKAHHTEAQVHPLLSAEEIVDRARQAAAGGAVRFGIVTSGRGCPEGKALDTICRAVERLRAQEIVSPCLSLGLLKPDQARRLADAGAVRYHHNLEAGPAFFPRVCTTHSYEDRVDTVLTARAAGLEVCVGGIVGLGESADQRAEFLMAVAGLEPESVPLNFLNPIPGTRLESVKPLSALEALAAVAVTRLLVPGAHIRTCGGRRQVLDRLAPLMYLAGASATMTGNYLTTPGQEPQQDALDIAALSLESVKLSDL